MVLKASGLRTARLLLVALCLLALPAGAAEILSSPKSPAPEPSAEAVSGRCLEWTDGCRICARPPGGEAACSNVGIACLPGKLRCVRR
jgi:hypothetical protein